MVSRLSIAALASASCGRDRDRSRSLQRSMPPRAKIIHFRLANDTVWAGFASVNQTNPNLIAFAGQFNGESNYYNQELNYVWVTDRSMVPPTVAPLDRQAPNGPAFLQKFQARAGWWSPDGRWFAFESNRICNDTQRSDLRHLHSRCARSETGDADHRLPVECSAPEMVSTDERR